MSDDFLSDRRKALEESFFKKRNDALLDNLRKKMIFESKRTEFAMASGIRHPELIERLLGMNIEPDTLAALALVPMVRVAWADGKLEDAERKAIMRAAKEAGLEESNPSFQWLLTWLESPPDEQLIKSWTEYVLALRDILDPDDCQELCDALVGRARDVAVSAGGFLGLVNPISPEEQAVLDEMKSTFAK